MKWSQAAFEGDPSAAMMAGRHIPHPTPPQPIRPQLQVQGQYMEYGRSLARSQDDEQVNYFYQRPHNDNDFAYQKGHRWAVGDDSVIDVSREKWVNGSVMYNELENGGEQFTAMRRVSRRVEYGQQIAPAKKLWGVEEGKADNKGIFNIGEASWREATWSTGTGHATGPHHHGVGQSHGLGMGVGQRGHGRPQFPGGDSVLSPRATDHTGVGLKMVEYVLASSPTGKDLDARMANLALRNGGVDSTKDKKDKAPSPFDSAKKDVENGNAPQANGIVQNGLDDDKTFNVLQSHSRTPGSRQGSPSEEDLNKNGMVPGVGVKEPELVGGGVVMGGPGAQVLGHLDHSGFDGVGGGAVGGMGGPAGMLDPSMSGAGGPFSSPAGPDYNNMATSMPMDSPTLLPAPGGPQPQNFTDSQQLFRNAQQQQQQGGPNHQQIQLLAQQQYLAAQAAQQQGLAAPPAAFSAPYVINAQEPYVGTLITGPTAVIPQYYGVHWGVYPANIIQQQGPGGQPRRPISPSQTSEVTSQSNGNLAASAAAAAGNMQGPLSQYQQVIPAYYDQNGTVLMGNLRGVGNGAPVRLVSPAPVLINGANGAQAAAANNMRLLGNQAPQIGTPPASLYNNSQTPSLNSSQTFTGSTLAGLGSSSMGRRDSLDRTTSVLSPLSQDFRSAKWTSNYGALGTVTASPGPIGLTSGSLTPPPSLSNTSSALPLGALMSGNRVISAAPGAEAKFRNGSTNGMFNSGGPSSLFPPLKRNLSLDKCTGRSRLLEDFRNNRFPNLQLRDLANHIVEFSQDQHGSRFIQQKLERATPAEKQMVFNEILTAAYSLMTDVFGNYVIQKFFEFGTPDQKTVLANKIRGHVLPLALQMYGCRVIQKALECITQDQQKDIVRELDGHVLKCVKDQNGNHVVQKCIECVDPMALQFIINAFQGQVFTLSTHPYGCRVIQRILEHCTGDQTSPVLEELHQHTEQLLQDQYGNYVIQHVLEHGKPEDKSKIVGVVRGGVLKLSQHKFASNVVEKCVTHATRAERAMLIEEVNVCGYSDNSHSSLLVLMKDQYANYVVQKMIDVAEPAQRKMLMHKIRPHISTLRKYTYGKHILAKLEKYFIKNAPDTMGPSMTSPL
ncbi:pumilio homolog 2-like isoform X6 [Homarus americanus]|uniref:pumilio homolog 2-like isoform X6 n=1 Tax=Homarus americanus TaxID=6706 RepID=UPI001C49259D|nr:pumilio homolog 2-like isoform X6 [Homarus americanus]